jgi:hypothetical protein
VPRREQRGDAGDERLVLEGREAVQGQERQKRREVHGAADAVHVARVEVKGLAQHRHEGLVGVGGDFQADRIAPDALAETLLDHLEQVFSLLLLEGQVGVPRDAEDGVIQHAEAAEQFLQVLGDDVFQQHEANAAAAA